MNLKKKKQYIGGGDYDQGEVGRKKVESQNSSQILAELMSVPATALMLVIEKEAEPLLSRSWQPGRQSLAAQEVPVAPITQRPWPPLTVSTDSCGTRTSPGPSPRSRAGGPEADSHPSTFRTPWSTNLQVWE